MDEFTEVDMHDVDPASPKTVEAITGVVINSPPKDEAPDRCLKCGEGLTYSGRGRRPKYCDNCKRTSSPRAAKSESDGPRWKPALATKLTNNLVGVAMVVSALNAFDGMAILQGSQGLANSLVDVAENDPKVRKALENFTTASAWGGVAIAAAAIAIPILANHGYLPPAMAAAYAPPTQV